MLKQFSYLFFLNTILFVLIEFEVIQSSFIENSILDDWKSSIALASLFIGITLFKISNTKKTT
jgi:hypothetical protein